MQRHKKQIFVSFTNSMNLTGNLKYIFIVIKEEEAFYCLDWVQAVGEGMLI